MSDQYKKASFLGLKNLLDKTTDKLSLIVKTHEKSKKDQSFNRGSKDSLDTSYRVRSQ